jgi:Zn-dependent protease
LQQSDFIRAFFEFVILIFSLCVHECAHAWMASRLGDQTARMVGRVSLNPMVHVDPIGTLLFPALMIFGPFMGFSFFGGMLVGWAKPTPVNTRNFRKIVRDDNLTTLAGPVSNLLLVLAGFCVLAAICVAVPNGRLLVLSTFQGGLISDIPLDGSRVVRNLLPYNAVQMYDRIPIWMSYLLMIFLGPFFLGIFFGPALRLVLWGLFHV